MQRPAVNDTISTEYAIKLCQHYGFDYLVKRLKGSPTDYKDWVFDGVSMVPDELFSKFLNIPDILEVALKHDLKYAYGEPGNRAEKLRADLEFEIDLLNDGASPEIARIMFAAVDIGGSEILNTSYSWAFAQR